MLAIQLRVVIVKLTKTPSPNKMVDSPTGCLFVKLPLPERILKGSSGNTDSEAGSTIPGYAAQATGLARGREFFAKMPTSAVIMDRVAE